MEFFISLECISKSVKRAINYAKAVNNKKNLQALRYGDAENLGAQKELLHCLNKR